MNTISNYICSYYSNTSECPIPPESDLKIVAAALVGIGLVAISYSWLSRKEDPQMIKVFEERWRKITHRPAGINGFITEQDTVILNRLFEDWRLTSGFCLFELLGADIHRKWKALDADPATLTRFCELSNELSTVFLVTIWRPGTDNAPAIRRLHREFSNLAPRVPPELKDEYQLILKILSNPRKAIPLGSAPVQYFDNGEKLDGKETKPQDIRDFLEFAALADPFYEPLLHCKSGAELSKKLNQLISNIHRDGSRSPDPRLHVYTDVCLNLLNRIKETVDERFLNIELPLFRMFNNILHFQDFESSKHSRWFDRKYSEFISPDFYRATIKLLTPHPHGLIRLDHTVGSEDEIKTQFRVLAARLPVGQRTIYSLEQHIIKKLHEVKNQKKITEEEYANIFANMVRLYQIVHDFRYVRDPNQDLLEGRNFPPSFAALSCLPSPSDEVKPITTPIKKEKEEAPKPSHKTASSPEEPSEFAVFPLIFDEEEEKVSSSQDAPASLPVSELQRPDFPEKNAKPQEVMQILLGSGFVIERVKGSHYQLKHVTTNVATTVPYHGEPLKRGTLASIRNAFYRSQGFSS